MFKYGYILCFQSILLPLHSLKQTKGTLAQVVEQWTENPCVLGSTPRGTTLTLTKTVSYRNCLFYFYFICLHLCDIDNLLTTNNNSHYRFHAK